jgi:DNA polymerase III epsilon subunit-like protein
VKPYGPIHPDAAKVNGYTHEKWEEAPRMHVVLEEIQKRFGKHKYIPAGWNIGFDLAFISPSSQHRINLSYHPLDLMGIGWNKIAFVERPHLEDLCRMVGVSTMNAHTALGDTELMVLCYKILMAEPEKERLKAAADKLTEISQEMGLYEDLEPKNTHIWRRLARIFGRTAGSS